MTDVEPKYPSGFACFIDFGVNNEPLIRLMFQGDGEATAVVLTTHEAAVMMSVVGETMMRCAVITEMTTMWPEQRDKILENLQFRWSGGGGLDDGSADQGS